MRVVATLTGGSRLVGRSVQIVLLTLVELVVGLFTGRFGEALSSLRALVGLVPRSFSLVARRRAIQAQRSVPEREVLGLQVRGSARIASYLRGRETTTYVRAGMTVRRWRETSFGPLLAWFVVLTAIAIGSRTYFDQGVPTVGEFLTFPESAAELAARYGSAWDPRSFGLTSPVPSGWLALAALSGLALFKMSLAMTLSVVGLFVVGAAGYVAARCGLPGEPFPDRGDGRLRRDTARAGSSRDGPVVGVGLVRRAPMDGVSAPALGRHRHRRPGYS